MRNEIINGDSYEVLKQLKDKSFDTVIIDPPYGMGIDTWDTPVDVAFFTEQVKRVGKEFYAVFGQMPYIREWDRQAEKAGLHFLEHISWVKRNGSPSVRLNKTHEEIYIYALGKRKKFYQTKGKYEDVKVPGVLFDLVSIEGIKRYISELKAMISGTSDGKHDNNFKGYVYRRFSTLDSRLVRAPFQANYTNVWSFLPESKKTYNKGGKFHSTAKSLLLEMRLVEMLTPEGGSVLDFFSGSGTTAIACQRLGREFLCIEKEREFYEHSVDRLNSDTWQPELDMTKNI